MFRLRKDESNVGVSHGIWGEDVAVEFLRRKGFTILDRNSRPFAYDLRLELDIVAFEPKSETIVFVEVKQHSDFSPYARRLRSITERKRRNLRRASNAWRRKNRWQGGYRFDVIEIYGTPDGGAPVIDHIERVELFNPDRFVRWC